MIHSSNKLINRDRGGERRKAANAIPSNNVHKSSADATQLYYNYHVRFGWRQYSLPSLPPELGKDISRIFSIHELAVKEIQPESVL